MGETEVEVDIIPVKGIASVGVTLYNNGEAWSSDDITAITTILNNIFDTIQIDDYTSITIDNPVVIYNGNESNITCNITYARKNNPKDINNMIINALGAEGYEVAF